MSAPRAAAPRAGAGSAARLVVERFPLLLRVTRDDVRARHAGSILGLAWFALSPLLVLAVYAAIYVLVFRVRVEGLTPWEYVLFVFAGLVPFLSTGEALGQGVPSVVANRGTMTSTVFPIELIPARAVLAAQGTMAVGLAVVLLGALASGRLGWPALLVPLLWALQALFLLGVVWALSLVNVVLRDLQHGITLLMMVLLVASPIAYTPEMVPGRLRPLLVLNPLAWFITAWQEVLVLGRVPSAGHLAVLVALSLGAFFAGGFFFARAKRMWIDYV
jgi:lipopolysaccharide transport system permease protein